MPKFLLSLGQLPKRVADQNLSDQPEDLSSFEDYETRPQYIPKRVRSAKDYLSSFYYA
jgi:hypothetical protein